MIKGEMADLRNIKCYEEVGGDALCGFRDRLTHRPSQSELV